MKYKRDANNEIAVVWDYITDLKAQADEELEELQEVLDEEKDLEESTYKQQEFDSTVHLIREGLDDIDALLRKVTVNVFVERK